MKTYSKDEQEGEFKIDSNSKAMSFLTMPISIIRPLSVKILDRSHTAAQAILTMKESSSRSVLVSDSNKEIIGIVSETDILYKVFLTKKDPSKVKIFDIMSSPIISVSPQTPIRDALEIMQIHSIGQVAVIENPKIYGVVTRNDIIVKIERAAIETANAFNIDTAVCIMNPFASISVSNSRSMLECPHCQTKYNDRELLLKHSKALHKDKDIE